MDWKTRWTHKTKKKCFFRFFCFFSSYFHFKPWSWQWLSIGGYSIRAKTISASFSVGRTLRLFTEQNHFRFFLLFFCAIVFLLFLFRVKSIDCETKINVLNHTDTDNTLHSRENDSIKRSAKNWIEREKNLCKSALFLLHELHALQEFRWILSSA